MTRLMDAVRIADTEVGATKTLAAAAAATDPAIIPASAMPHAEVQLFETQVLPAIRTLHHEQAAILDDAHDTRSKEEIERSVARWEERNNRWLDDNTWLENRAAFVDARLRARDVGFAKRWQHVNAHWDAVKARLDATPSGRDGHAMALAYANGGTEVVAGMVDEISHMIAQRAAAGRDLAGSVVSQ